MLSPGTAHLELLHQLRKRRADRPSKPEFARFVRTESERAAQLVQAAGINLQSPTERNQSRRFMVDMRGDVVTNARLSVLRPQAPR